MSREDNIVEFDLEDFKAKYPFINLPDAVFFRFRCYKHNNINVKLFRRCFKFFYIDVKRKVRDNASVYSTLVAAAAKILKTILKNRV